LLDQIPLQHDIYREGIKEREDNKRERGDYLRETIISTVSIRETINQGMAIIQGNKVYWLPPIFLIEQSLAVISSN